MKFVLITMVFSTMLFSWQKQIILGSFSIESNAHIALEVAKKNIEADSLLKKLIDENGLEITNSVIGDYTVVTVRVFDTFTPLENAEKGLKSYYDDLFSLRYFKGKDAIAGTSEQIEEDVVKEIEDEQKRAELVKLLKEEKLVEEIYEEKVAEVEMAEVEVQAKKKPETIQKEELNEQVATVPKVQKNTQASVQKPQKNITQEQNQDRSYLVLLAALAIVLAGIIIYRATNIRQEKDV